MGGRNHDHQTTNRLDSRWTTWVPLTVGLQKIHTQWNHKGLRIHPRCFLIGGWTNPFEKYAQVKLDHETPGIGMNIKNISNHLPVEDSPVFFSPKKNGYVWNSRSFRKLQKKVPMFWNVRKFKKLVTVAVSVVESYWYQKNKAYSFVSWIHVQKYSQVLTLISFTNQ